MIAGGESYISARPVFSGDGRRLLVCTGCTVSVFSTSTGMLVTELEGHGGFVTAVVVAPVSAAAAKCTGFCWTASLDGTICYWDFMTSELIKKVAVGLPVHFMVITYVPVRSASKNEALEPYAFISVEDTNKKADGGQKDANKKADGGQEDTNKKTDGGQVLRGQVQMYKLENSRRVGGLLAETSKPEPLSISKSGNFLGMPYNRRLYVWSVPTNDFKVEHVRRIVLHHTKELRTVAFHPTERMVAAGDTSGRILIWRDFGGKKFSESSKLDAQAGARPGLRLNDDADSCSTWHWHPTEVRFLHFSSDGAYLFSGGREGVIVVWQLDSGKRKYKPRLGSTLLYFSDSPDPSISCVSCADNRIHILKMPTMEITKSIAGIKLPSLYLDKVAGSRGGYAFDCLNGLVAIRSVDYSIQLYSLFDNVEVSQVQVCERNFYPVNAVTVYVALVALSDDGSLMCTVDVGLPEMGLGGHSSLKFWTSGSRRGEFNLTTIIYEPHDDAKVSSAAFRPGHSMAMSTSFGGNFKIWIDTSSSQIKDGQNSGWRCQSVGSYKKKPMTAATFSADGSVLAVAAECVITLWDPDSNTLVAVIGETISPITKLSFVGASEYLVSLSQKSNPQLAVWKTSTLAMSWSYKLLVEDVCCTTNTTLFAVLALQTHSSGTRLQNQDGVILLFDAENPIPCATWSAKKARCGGLAFVRKDSPTSQDNPNEDKVEKEAPLLAYINGDHEYIVFDPQNKDVGPSKIACRSRQVLEDETGLVGYTSVYGELPKLEAKNAELDIPFIPSERPWESIFSGSSHACPPLALLASAFFPALIEKKMVGSG